MIDQASIPLNNNFSVKVVSRQDDLANLRDDWNKLASKQGSYMPFLCFDWFQLWIEHFLDNHQLFILLFYEDDNLETIAPFMMKKGKFKGANVRRIELIGNVYSPVRYFLFGVGDDRERVKNLSLIFQFLLRSYKDWDIMDLYPIPEENNNCGVLNESLDKSSLKTWEYVCFGDWYLDGINYSSDTYFANLSRKQRKNIRQCRNRTEKYGKVVFKMVTKRDEAEAYMKMYFRVYAKSWKRREGFGPGFYMDLTKHLANKDWLRLGFVLVDDVPIVAGIAVVCNGVAYFEKTAYDEDYEKLGAGSIWFAEMIKYVIDVDNVSVIDFLRGDEEYKKRWMPKRRERKGVLIFNNNLKGNYLSFLIRHIAPGFDRNRRLREIKAFATKKFFKTQ